MYKPNEIKFIEDVDFEKEKLIGVTKYPFTIKPLKKNINIPIFKINYTILKIRLFKKEVSAEDIIFEKIKHISHGNPGVAKVI